MMTFRNSSGQMEKDEEIFGDLFTTKSPKLVFMFLGTVLVLVNAIISYGMVWYERFGNDQVIIFFYSISD